MDKFDEMVEALEDNEDLVECQECFDLFPKADCMKQEHGYLCPTCGRPALDQERKIDFTDITTGLFDQDFPDVSEYAPGTTKDWDAEPTVMDALDALIADEIEAIDGYEEAEEIIEDSDLKDKEELLKTIEHIKEEEEEHIEELKDDCPECEVPIEAEVEDKTEVKESEESAGTSVEEADCTKHKAITHSEEEKTELKETYEKLFEQKLEEDNLTEVWPFDFKKKAGNDVDAVFDKGYVVVASGGAKQSVDTLEKALTICKAMSKKAPKDKVYIIPRAISEDKFNSYDPELQKLIGDQKNGFASALVRMQDGKELTNNIKSFAKFKKNIDKQNAIIDKTLEKGTAEDPRELLSDESSLETEVEDSKSTELNTSVDDTASETSEVNVPDEHVDVASETNSTEVENTGKDESEVSVAADKAPKSTKLDKANAASARYKKVLKGLKDLGVDISRFTVTGANGKTKLTPQFKAFVKTLPQTLAASYDSKQELSKEDTLE